MFVSSSAHSPPLNQPCLPAQDRTLLNPDQLLNLDEDTALLEHVSEVGGNLDPLPNFVAEKVYDCFTFLG